MPKFAKNWLDWKSSKIYMYENATRYYSHSKTQLYDTQYQMDGKKISTPMSKYFHNFGMLKKIKESNRKRFNPWQLQEKF